MATHMEHDRIVFSFDHFMHSHLFPRDKKTEDEIKWVGAPRGQ